MRTYPANFTNAIDGQGIAPATLVRIDVEAFGGNPALTLRLSHAKEPGVTDLNTGTLVWKNIIRNISDIVQPVDANTGFINSNGSVDIEVVNTPTNLFSPDNIFSSIFRDYNPDASVVRIYQWLKGEGLAEADITNEDLLMFKGVLFPPEDYDEQVCRFQVVQVSAQFGRRFVGRTLNKTDYPNAPQSSVGRFLHIPFGVCPKVPATPIHKNIETRLSSVLLKTGNVVNVLDTTGFSATGTVIIDDQEIVYTGLTATSFTGASGHTTHHYKGSVVAQKLTDYPYVLFDKNFPCQAIGNIYVDDHLVDPADVTKDLANGEITFAKRPRFNDKNDSQFLNVHFDAADATNNAVNPLNAIDPETTTDYAEVNQATPILALKQTDAMPAIGEISRALIQVTHFEEEKLTTDSLTVDIVGIGQVGSLNKPAVDDVIDISGNGDFSAPVIENLDWAFGGDSHLHTGEGSSSSIVEDAVTSVDETGNGVMRGSQFEMSSSSDTATLQINFPTSAPGVIKTDYEFSSASDFYAGLGTLISRTTGNDGDKVEVYLDFGGGVEEILTQLTNFGASVGIKTADVTKFTITGEPSTDSPTLKIRKTGGITITQWSINLQNVRRTLHYDDTLNVDANTTGGSNTKSGSISNVTGSADLGTASKSSNVVTDEIDITSQVNGDWSWFQDKVIQIKYNGTADGRTAFIILARFVVEYAFSQVKYAELVTADITGVVDDGSGTVTGSANALIERPDHVFKWSLLKGLLLAASTLDSASFTAVGTEFANAITGGYKFAGLMDKKIQIREWWAQWGKESRSVLYFERGEARLFFRPLNSSALTLSRTLKPADIIMQETSEGTISTLKIDKSRAEDVVNSIDLKYNRNFVEADHDDQVSAEDADSIARYGVSEKPDDFLCDWIRTQEMAEHLRDFFLEELKAPMDYGTFSALLKHIDLERFDGVGLSHPMLGGSDFAFPGILVGPSRQLGHGGTRRPDQMQFTVRMNGSSVQFNFRVPAAPADVKGDTVGPFVVIGNPVSPAPADAKGDTVGPVVVKGSMILLTNPAVVKVDTVNPVVRVDGSIIITANPAAMKVLTVNPVVFEGFPTPAPADVKGTTVGPVVVLGSVTITPAPAVAKVDTVNPVVVKGSMVILTAPAVFKTSVNIGWLKPVTWDTAIGTLDNPDNPNTWDNS